MYNIIVIDPPWPVKKSQRKSRPNQKTMDYKTMSLKEIYEIDIKSISDNNAQIFIWATHKHLPDAIKLIEKWGYKYQRTLTWDKANGMCLFGYHHRTEFVVMGYRGIIEPFPKRKAIPTLFFGKSERHSAKPDEFYNMLSELPGKKIDIFARKNRIGWHVFGDEVESDILLEATK